MSEFWKIARKIEILVIIIGWGFYVTVKTLEIMEIL